MFTILSVMWYIQHFIWNIHPKTVCEFPFYRFPHVIHSGLICHLALYLFLGEMIAFTIFNKKLKCSYWEIIRIFFKRGLEGYALCKQIFSNFGSGKLVKILSVYIRRQCLLFVPVSWHRQCLLFWKIHIGNLLTATRIKDFISILQIGDCREV